MLASAAAVGAALARCHGVAAGAVAAVRVALAYQVSALGEPLHGVELQEQGLPATTGVSSCRAAFWTTYSKLCPCCCSVNLTKTGITAVQDMAVITSEPQI